MNKNAERLHSDNPDSLLSTGSVNVAKTAARQLSAPIEWQASQRVSCRLCGESFDPLQMHGSYLDRHCPKCDGRLTEDDYDADAATWCVERKEVAELAERIREEMRIQQQRIIHPRWWQWRFKRRWMRKFQEAGARLEQCDQRQREAAKHLKQIALGRHYASEWFQCTHLPLRQCDNDGRLEFRLGPGYTAGGLFTLKAEKGVLSAGYAGEYIAFEQLRKRVVAPNSPLKGARLLPNLFLPNDGLEEEMQKGLWRQVDCVLATEKAAFVLEVKRWNARVSAKAPFAQVYVERSGDQNVFAPADNVLAGFGDLQGEYRQASQHNRKRASSKPNESHSRRGTRARSARKHHAQKHSQARRPGESRRRQAAATYLDEWDWWFEERAEAPARG